MNKGIYGLGDVISWMNIIPSGSIDCICSIQLTDDKKWRVMYVVKKRVNGKWDYKQQDLPDQLSFAFFQLLENVLDKSIDVYAKS